MNKKPIFSAVVFFLVSAAAIFALWPAKKPVMGDTPVPPAPAGQMVLYYGEGCFYCGQLDGWIKSNGIEAKVSYQKKEVFKNEANYKELFSTAKACGDIDEKLVGVPFLWTGSDCLIGPPGIEAFFVQKISGQGAQN